MRINIFYDSNQAFGNINSLFDLVKIMAVQLNSPSGINTID